MAYWMWGAIVGVGLLAVAGLMSLALITARDRDEDEDALGDWAQWEALG